MKVQSNEAVKRCVMNNLGIAIVPSYSIEEELKNGSLLPVKTELDEKNFNSIYVSRKTNNVINVVATISFFQKSTKFFQFPFCIFGKSVIFCISDRTL